MATAPTTWTTSCCGCSGAAGWTAVVAAAIGSTGSAPASAAGRSSQRPPTAITTSRTAAPASACRRVNGYDGVTPSMLPANLSRVGDGNAPSLRRPAKTAYRRRRSPLASNAVRYRSFDPVLVPLVGAAALALVVIARPGSGDALSPGRASWSVTPGVLNPEVTQAKIRETICRTGWTRTIRPPVDYTSPLKLEQMKAYRRTGETSEDQADHLISL